MQECMQECQSMPGRMSEAIRECMPHKMPGENLCKKECQETCQMECHNIRRIMPNSMRGHNCKNGRAFASYLRIPKLWALLALSFWRLCIHGRFKAKATPGFNMFSDMFCKKTKGMGPGRNVFFQKWLNVVFILGATAG